MTRRWIIALVTMLCLAGLLGAGIQVGGAATTSSAIPTAPRNSSVEQALPLNRLPFSSSESTVYAPQTSTDANCVGNGHAVWFRIDSRPYVRTYDIDTFGSDYDTTLSAWAGTPPGNLVQLACNDDGDSIRPQSQIEFDVPAGQSVLVMVASFDGASGGNLRLNAVSARTRPTHARCGLPTQRSAKNRCAADTLYYLHLGDSAGMFDGVRSFPELIENSRVSRHVPNLKLVKLACGNETSDTFINFSFCGGSQLQKAEDFLNANQGHVALVTIDIGGNDAAECANFVTGVDWTCAGRLLQQVLPTNMSTILGGLRNANGPGPQPLMVGMNYYNPFLVFRLLGPAVYPQVDQTIFGQHLLNDELRRLYAQFGMPTADVATAFHSDDLTTLVHSPWGTIPLAVERACSLLSGDCGSGGAPVPGLDPNVAGGAVIAGAFEQTIGRLSRPS